MADELSILNLAMVRLGEAPLPALDDTSERAQACTAIYAQLRDTVLADHPWNFATVRANLSPRPGLPLFGYSYMYGLPDGCLRLWGICGTNGEVDPSLHYQVEGQNVITNVQTNGLLPVKYSQQVTDESQFETGFVSALALRIAAEVAFRLTKNAALKGEILKEYLLELGKGKTQDSRQGTPKVVLPQSWLNARSGPGYGPQVEFGGGGGLPVALTPIPLSYLDPDPSLAAASDQKVASQKAAKAYIDAGDAAVAAIASSKLSPTGDGSRLSGLTAAQTGLGNVTNDAQLKRGADDFSSFAVKTGVGINDHLLIEDSEASWVKKYIRVGNLPWPSAASAAAIRGQSSNLQIAVTTATALTVTADEAVLEDASNNYRTVRGVNLAASTGISGVNGLDTGTIAPNTWYGVFAIYNSITSELAGLLHKVSPLGFNSQYPPAQSHTYVLATNDAGYPCYNATDPTKSLTGTIANGWQANITGNLRLHIDLGSAKVIKRLYYENGHSSGGETNRGVKDFTLWGSNNAAAFADTTYGHDANWTQLTVSQSVFDQHVALDQPDPKYINVTNSVAYRYYAVKIATNWGGSAYTYLRRIELQTNVVAAENDPILPDGYTYWARLGSVRVMSNGSLLPTLQRGNDVQIKNATGLPLMASGTMGANTPVAIGAFVPPTASEIKVLLVANAQVATVAPNANYGNYDDTVNPRPLVLNPSAYGSMLGSLIIESSNLYIFSSGSAAYWFAVGWKDNR